MAKSGKSKTAPKARSVPELAESLSTEEVTIEVLEQRIEQLCSRIKNFAGRVTLSTELQNRIQKELA